MRIDDKQIAAHRFIECIREMQAEWNDTVQQHMTKLVLEQEQSVLAWFGERRPTHWTCFSDERMHSVIEYENALTLLKPYDDAISRNRRSSTRDGRFSVKRQIHWRTVTVHGRFPGLCAP